MGSEAETGEEARKGRRRSKSPQKLSLFSLPIPQQSQDPPGMLTPPFKSPASVPFLWEEAPGKPLLSSNSSSSSAIARCLELPPRLQLMESFNNNTPSPTTVLDGPYVGRSSSFTSSSFGRDPLPPPPLLGSFRRGTGSPDDSDGILQVGSLIHSKKRDVISCSGRGYFGSSRKKVSFSSSKMNQEVSEVGCGRNTKSKVKISRFMSTGSSFFSLPRTRSSHLWESIYEGLKQVVPWRNKTTKKDGLTS